MKSIPDRRWLESGASSPPSSVLNSTVAVAQDRWHGGAAESDRGAGVLRATRGQTLRGPLGGGNSLNVDSALSVPCSTWNRAGTPTTAFSCQPSLETKERLGNYVAILPRANLDLPCSPPPNDQLA